ncbi:hypothetical protein Poli38472_000519 [Pythium oligandrum]|uniref:Uncharacterized protein n=1 Tax=Pythium oligandrum TaxID=41045 RepID=A0A8K1CDX4_PYTOL|nr:hypothetical protein Poli38472_000519 [Pythium oligandrum]|eukprot:TMW60477.1 hypothetical protein Poli38472_000519 [Pythium oligandrum]
MSKRVSNASPVLPPRYSIRLYRSSFSTCLSVALAAHLELYSCALMASVVLLTSLNYWRDPVHGWRRTVDMSAVCMAIMYHIYCSTFCENVVYQVTYALFLFKTGYCYRQARQSTNKNISSAWHCGMHILGNVANMLLYTGLAA